MSQSNSGVTLADDITVQDPSPSVSPMSKNRLTWANGVGTVVTQDYTFHSDEKFDLGFDYESLYYEPILGNAMKLVLRTSKDTDGNDIVEPKMVKLTVEEINTIEEFCIKYIDIANYIVFAYDPENGLYAGSILKSEAIEKGFKWTIIGAPNFEASKWVDNNWVRLKATILETGHMNIDPVTICNLCIMGLTEEEYNAWPPRPNEHYVWDFREEKWVDRRELSTTIYNALLSVRTNFEAARWRTYGKYIPQYEQSTWMDQCLEAQAFLDDPSTETPYLDTFLANREDDYIPTKEELAKDVLTNHKEWKVVMAKINAKQWNYLKKIEHAATCADVDRFQKEATEWCNKQLAELGSEVQLR